jgi:very-short-patch-repair endonuclease
METSGHAKKLRKNMTDAERKLWTPLRGRQLTGVKFRRQHQVGPYVVDFIAFEPKLIIELDGGHHALQLAADGKRSDWLTSNSFTVLRFWNHEVLQKTDAVLQTITKRLAKQYCWKMKRLSVRFCFFNALSLYGRAPG